MSLVTLMQSNILFNTINIYKENTFNPILSMETRIFFPLTNSPSMDEWPGMNEFPQSTQNS